MAVVIVPHFSGARANGATQWISQTKAMIQLSLRYKWEDIFWFSFFHEAGHLVLHRKKDVFVEPPKPHEGLDTADPTTVRREREADRFAARALIPPRYERRLRLLRLIDIPEFAEQLRIAPAIVIGRMQHDGLLAYNQGHDLRRQFEFVEDVEQARPALLATEDLDSDLLRALGPAPRHSDSMLTSAQH